MSEDNVMELRRLNVFELKTLLKALGQIAGKGDTPYAWSAKIMLENDAEFVRGLFWTSRKGKSE